MNLSSLERGLSTVPDDPFYQPRAPLWLPDEMVTPPSLDAARAGALERRYALLVNP